MGAENRDHLEASVTVICPPCYDRPGNPEDPLNLCARHRRELDALPAWTGGTGRGGKVQSSPASRPALPRGWVAPDLQDDHVA